MLDFQKIFAKIKKKEPKFFRESKNIFPKTFFPTFFNFRKIHQYSFPISYWRPSNSFWSRRTSDLNSQTSPTRKIPLPHPNFATTKSSTNVVTFFLPEVACMEILETYSSRCNFFRRRSWRNYHSMGCIDFT